MVAGILGKCALSLGGFGGRFCEGLLSRVTGDGNLLYFLKSRYFEHDEWFQSCSVNIKLVVASALRLSKSCFCRSVGDNLQVLLEAV